MKNSKKAAKMNDNDALAYISSIANPEEHGFCRALVEELSKTESGIKLEKLWPDAILQARAVHGLAGPTEEAIIAKLASVWTKGRMLTSAYSAYENQA